MARNEYKLVRGGVDLGVVTNIEDDQPNHVGRFTPLPGFESVRPLFEEEVRLLHGGLSSSPRWNQVRNEIDAPVWPSNRMNG